MKHTVATNETYQSENDTFVKHVFKNGTGTLKPNDGAVCEVVISMIDSENTLEVEEDMGDYNLNGKQTEVTIGEGDSVLSELFDDVLLSMTEGEAAYVKIKCSGLPIKCKELKINVSIISISRTVDISELEEDEKLDLAQHHKNKGTFLFKSGRICFAQKRFKKALSSLDHMTPDNLPESLRDNTLKLTQLCHLNMALCCLKLENYESVLVHCEKVLELDEKCVKAFFRMGLAFTHLQNYKSALTFMRKAASIEPQNREVREQIKKINMLDKEYREVYIKMFK